MSINPGKYRTTNTEEERKKRIKYFTIFIIVLVPLYFGYTGINNIKPKKNLEKNQVETGDRPLEKELVVMINADGGLNFRKEANKNSEKIGEIPNRTKLTVKKELSGWYFISYNEKEGWIAKEFTVLEEAVKKEEEEVTGLPEFNGLAYGFRLKYPVGWSVKDYGIASDGDAKVGLSFSELPSTLMTGFFIPIDIKITAKTREESEAVYKNLANKTVAEVDISGVKGVKYVYTDSIDGTEKAKVFLTISGKTVVISENGGYGQELEQIIKTFKVQ